MQKSPPSKAYFICAAFLVACAYGTWNGSLKRLSVSPFSVFQNEVARTIDFRLINSSDRLPFKTFSRAQVSQFFGQGHVLVSDIDKDGLEDALFIFWDESYSLVVKMVRHLTDDRWIDVTQAARLADLEKIRIVSAVFVDMDNDGWEDLVTVDGDYNLRLQMNTGGRFSEPIQKISLDGLNGRVLSIADVDRDGLTDLIVAGYFASKNKQFVLSDVRSSNGGDIVLFKNVDGKSFVEAGRSDPSQRRHALAIGLGYIGPDKHLGMYVADDFGIDRFFRIQSDFTLVDESRARLGHLRSNYSMSAETGDVNGDGLVDFYVSNMNRPFFARRMNALWTQSLDGQAFENVARALKVDTCGVSWGAKFFDFNRDGHLDLLVVNSPVFRDDSDWPFFMNVTATIPRDIFNPARIYGEKARLAVGFRTPFEKVNDHQRNCLFLRSQHNFEDVATAAGLTDRQGGKGVALLDPLGDGNCGFLIANAESEPTYYQCQYHGKNPWIGIELRGSDSNRGAIGARVLLKTDRGTYLRENFPTNGFQSQSTKRILFPLPENEKFVSMEVEWPSGRTQSLQDIRLNTYNLINE